MYNRDSGSAVELVNSGKISKNTEQHGRLRLESDCSLNINKVSKEDHGSYSCRQYLDDNSYGNDARVFLHVLHVSSSQTEIRPGRSVTLSCQLFAVEMSNYMRTELMWMNQSGINLKSDSRFQISSKNIRYITLSTTLLKKDHGQAWSCWLVQGNELKVSATYNVKMSNPDTKDCIRAGSLIRGILIIAQIAVFAAPTVILLQIFCSRRAAAVEERLMCSSVLGKLLVCRWLRIDYMELLQRFRVWVELVNSGKIKDREKHGRLRLGSDCSLNITDAIKEDVGFYSCHQYVNVSSSQTEIRPGDSVTLSCRVFSYSFFFCDSFYGSKNLQLKWVNQAGVTLESDSRYKIHSSSSPCSISLSITLLDGDLDREWRCELTDDNHLKKTTSYTIKIPAAATTETQTRVRSSTTPTTTPPPPSQPAAATTETQTPPTTPPPPSQPERKDKHRLEQIEMPAVPESDAQQTEFLQD
ncbi:hypothetical protein DNTS_001934 [Danionella cerebrum]|uniref:Ig-like domain-containing protein n=1 Tax=Danionella cerebrum TaxID=2873325 RepID=A0A553PVA7_9TELE|nr:hypothetical protein DNTS_001934 [Danionella translucida]